MSDVPCAAGDCTFRSESPFAVLPYLVSLPFFTCDKCKTEFVKQDDGSWKANAKVLKFDPVVVGEGYRFDPDELLDIATAAHCLDLCKRQLWPYWPEAKR